MPLVLANEAGGGAPWVGTLLGMTIWDRGVDPHQAVNLFDGQDPGPPAAAGRSFRIDWRERPE